MRSNRVGTLTTSLGRAGATFLLMTLAATSATAHPRGLRRPRVLAQSSPSAPSGAASLGAYTVSGLISLTGTDGVGRAGPSCRPRRGTLRYHGGELVLNPDVFVIFWGPQWQSDQTHIDAATAIETLYQQIGTSDYACSWGEFAVAPGPVGQGTYAGSDFIAGNPPSPLSDTTIRNMILSEVAANRAPAPTNSTVYVVVPPQGVPVDAGGATGCGGSNFVFCGYHDSFLSAPNDRVRYAVLPFPCNSGAYTCFVDALDNAGTAFQVVGSHELAEVATDPDSGSVGLGGWYNERNGDENADMCAHNGCDGEVAAGAQILSVNSLWSNLAKGCVTSVSCAGAPGECTDSTPGFCTTALGRTQQCALEWLVDPNMRLKRSGLPASIVKCSDGQPFCDADGASDGQCTFQVNACLNSDDPRVVCTPTPIDSLQVLQPSTTSSDPNQQATAQQLLTALDTVDPNATGSVTDATISYSPPAASHNACTGTLSVTVPLRLRGGRTVRGVRQLSVKAHTAAGAVVSRVTLICNPPLQ